MSIFHQNYRTGQRHRHLYLLLAVSEYFSNGIWNRIDSIKDPSLRSRASTLPLLIHSRWAQSTHKYEPAWCSHHPESRKLPADPLYIALYFNDMAPMNRRYRSRTKVRPYYRWIPQPYPMWYLKSRP